MAAPCRRCPCSRSCTRGPETRPPGSAESRGWWNCHPWPRRGGTWSRRCYASDRLAPPTRRGEAAWTGTALRSPRDTPLLERAPSRLPVAAEAEYARDGGVGHDLRLVVIEHDVPVVPRGNGLHQLVEARPVASRVLLAHLRVMLSTRRHLSTRNVSVHEAQHGHEHAYASAANRAPTLVQRTDENVARRWRFEGVREGEDLGGMARACTHGVAGAHADRNVALAAQAQTHQRARVVARATHHLAGG